MQSRRRWAREIAEEGFDTIVEGEEEVGWRMVDEARKIDPKAVDELAEEIKRDTENIVRFVQKKIANSVENPSSTGGAGKTPASCLRLPLPAGGRSGTGSFAAF